MVVTAEEIIEIVEEKGMNRQPAKWMWLLPAPWALVFIWCCTQLVHPLPRMSKKMRLNGVEAYGGLAAVDTYIGAAQLPENDRKTKFFRASLWSAHVIHDLVARKPIGWKLPPQERLLSS